MKKQKAGVSGVSDEMKKMKTLITGFIAAYGGKKLCELLIGSNDEMEQYTTSLEVMLGSTEKASAMIEKMRDFAAKTPLTLENVISGGSLLMSYGVDESNLIDTMTKLGDLARGNAEKMDRITLAYGQMLAKGKVTGEELMQMTEAGVPLQTALAESIGVTGEEFSKMVSAGKVGIDDLNETITELTTGDGKFAGMMEKQSETMQGMLSTLQDNVSEFFRKMGEGAFGEVKSALQEASNLLAEWEEDGTLDKWAQGIGVMLKNLIAFLKQAISVGLDFKEAIIAGAVALGTFKIAIGIGNVISATVAAVKSFSTATKAATAAQATFNAVGAANPYVFIGAAVLTAIVGIATFAATTNNATQSVEELTQAASKLSDEAQKSADNAKTLEEVMAKYESAATKVQSAAEKTQTLKDLQEQLNSAYGNTKDAIDLVNGSYEENIEKLQAATEAERENARIKAQAAVNNNNKAQRELIAEDAFANASVLNGIESGAIDNPNIKVGNVSVGMGNGTTIRTVEIGGETFAEKAQAYLDYIHYLESVGQKESDAFTQASEMYEKYNNLAAQAAEDEALLAVATETTTNKTKENTDKKSNNIKTTEELADSTADLIKNLNELASAYAEQGKNGNISYDTMLKLIDAGYTQCISLDNETGKIKLNTEAYKELAKAKLASQIAEYDATIGTSDTPNINSYYDQQEWEAKKDLRLKRDALKAMYDNFDNYMEAGSFSGSGSSSSSSSSDNEFKKASEAYKTEADKKIALIKRELEAKKELRDATIKAIDDEIEARKRLNEDNDLEKQINEVKAQLKYSQLDEFSREQMEKKLQGLYDDKAEKNWQRNAQARKDAANAKYESEQKSYNNQISAISESLKTVQQIMSAMADGSKSVESIVNNNNTRNNTANVNLIGTALTMAQITKAVKDALMDDIVIR